MFMGADFDGDLSMWDVSKVASMQMMFSDSQFTGNLARWRPVSLGNPEVLFGQASAFLCGKGLTPEQHTKNVLQSAAANPARFGASGMFARTFFQHDVAAWGLPLSVDTTNMFLSNPQGLRAQTMRPWTVHLHVQSGEVPLDPYWAKLFQQLLPMGQTLGLTPLQQTQAIWDAHLGLEFDAFLECPEQSVGSLF